MSTGPDSGPGFPPTTGTGSGMPATGATAYSPTTDTTSGLSTGGARHGAVPPTVEPENQSVGELFADVSRDLSTLMRQEVELAKAEATQSAKRAGKGAGLLSGAGVAGHFVLLFLSIALWWWLGNLVTRGFSAVIVAVIWAIIAAILASRGRKELKATPGMPETTDTVKKIPNALKGHEEKNS